MNDNIRSKLYDFIDTLEESTLIHMLDKSKKEMFENTDVQNLIEIFNEDKELNTRNIQQSKKDLYNNELVKKYLKYENELNYIILDLNNSLNKLIEKKGCK